MGFNHEVIEILCEQVLKEGRLVIGTLRAKEAAEVLLRVLSLKTPAEPFAKSIQAVVNQRLIRKLCNACKEVYNPPTDLVEKLGLPTSRVDAFYREPQNRSSPIRWKQWQRLCDSFPRCQSPNP